MILYVWTEVEDRHLFYVAATASICCAAGYRINVVSHLLTFMDRTRGAARPQRSPDP